MKFCNVLCVCLLVGSAHAQSVIPFKYTSEEDNRLVKENDSLKYYEATGDPLNVVAINEETMHYQLVVGKDKKKVLAEGDIVGENDNYLQSGRWVQYHPNGRVQLAGNFYRGKPVGTWEENYPDGKVKKVYNFGLISDKDGLITCLSGEYREYYNDGNLKVSGYYAADRAKKSETVQVEDPISGKNVNSTISKSVYTARKAGTWEYYTADGEVERKDEN